MRRHFSYGSTSRILRNSERRPPISIRFPSVLLQRILYGSTVSLGRFLYRPVTFVRLSMYIFVQITKYRTPCTFSRKLQCTWTCRIPFLIRHVFPVTAGVNSPVITNYFPLICNLFLTNQCALQQHAESCL